MPSRGAGLGGRKGVERPGSPGKGAGRPYGRHFYYQCCLWDGSRERGDQKGSTSEAAVFKLPAYDPVGIAVLGFGIVFAVALALVF